MVQASRGNSTPSTLTVAKEGVGVLEEVEEQGRCHSLREERQHSCCTLVTASIWN